MSLWLLRHGEMAKDNLKSIEGLDKGFDYQEHLLDELRGMICDSMNLNYEDVAEVLDKELIEEVLGFEYFN